MEVFLALETYTKLTEILITQHLSRMQIMFKVRQIYHVDKRYYPALVFKIQGITVTEG